MSDKTLLPCPFCGSNDYTVALYNKACVTCKCGAFGPDVEWSPDEPLDAVIDRADAAWNHRPDSALRVAPDANVEAVRESLLTRSEVGLAKYGVTTERTDLSPVEWVTHLQQELMDASVYAEKLKRILLSNQALRVALEGIERLAKDIKQLQWGYDGDSGCVGIAEDIEERVKILLAALAKPKDAPQYSKSALDRFAGAGAKAWANPPESAKLIRQVEATNDAQKDGEWLEPAKLNLNQLRTVRDCPACEGDVIYRRSDRETSCERCGAKFSISKSGDLESLDAARSRGEGRA